MARTFDPLARRLCKAVHDLMKSPPHDGVLLDRATAQMNVTNQELIEGAVAHAVQKGWLQVKRMPATTRLILTVTGHAIGSKGNRPR